MIENLLNSLWLFEQGQTELFGKSTLGVVLYKKITQTRNCVVYNVRVLET